MIDVEPFYADFGRRLRLHRERAQMTQERLGRTLDPPTTRASIANIEAGNQRVLAHTLVQLAAAVGAPVTELLPSAVERRTEAIKDELLQKLELPDRQLHRVVEKLTSRKGGRNR